MNGKTTDSECQWISSAAPYIVTCGMMGGEAEEGSIYCPYHQEIWEDISASPN
jgi:hypothetical protein